jgi:Ca2+-transporting ATPase
MRCRLNRSSKSSTLRAAGQLVIGDVLEIEAGDLVAADARLLEAVSLRCGESALAGESEAVNKDVVALENPELPLGDRANMLFKGTSVATGHRWK